MAMEEVGIPLGSAFWVMVTCKRLKVDGEEHMTSGTVTTSLQCKKF